MPSDKQVIPDIFIDGIVTFFLSPENTEKYLNKNNLPFGLNYARNEKKKFILKLISKKRGKKIAKKMKVIYENIFQYKEALEYLGQVGEMLQPILSIMPMEMRLIISAVLLIPLIIPLILFGIIVWYLLEKIELTNEHLPEGVRGKKLPPIIHNIVRTWKMLYSIGNSQFLNIFRDMQTLGLEAITSFVTMLFSDDISFDDYVANLLASYEDVLGEDFIDITTRGKKQSTNRTPDLDPADLLPYTHNGVIIGYYYPNKPPVFGYDGTIYNLYNIDGVPITPRG